MQITETILLIVVTVITAFSAFSCLIALATPRWSLFFGLFCKGCSTNSAGLSIVALILLILSIVCLVLLILKILPKSLRPLVFALLFLGTVFTLASYGAFFDLITGYSYKLMVFAHFLCYVASLLVAFWLGGSYAGTIVAAN